MVFVSNTIQYNTIQYNTIQYNTIQYNTIQYNTIQYNTIQYNTIQYNTIQYNTIHNFASGKVPEQGIFFGVSTPEQGGKRDGYFRKFLQKAFAFLQF